MLKQKKKYGMSTYLIASAIAFGFHYGFWYVVNPVIFYKGDFPWQTTILEFIYCTAFACGTIGICNIVVSMLRKYPLRKYTLPFGLIIANTLVWLFTTIFVFTLNAILWNDNMTEVRQAIFIYCVIGLLITCTYGIWRFGKHLLSNEQLISKLQIERIKREEEISNLQLHMLTGQMNPHFIFNTLNIICGNIASHPDKAIRMIGDFADIYRYVARHYTEKCERITDAVEFNKRYLSMILTDSMNQYTCEIDLPKADGYLPMLSLQLVLENAFMHNKHTAEEPLYMKVYIEDDCICVTNSLNPISDSKKSLSVAIGNLCRRYEILCGKKLQIVDTDKFHTVKLPIIQEHELPHSRR